MLVICFHLLYLIGCTREKTQTNTKYIFLGVAVDVSGSFENNSQALTMEHFDQLISILSLTGGELAFGLIDARSFEKLTRLQIQSVTGRLDERARINQQNQRFIQEFKSIVSKQLNSNRAQYTDIVGVLERFHLFFNEPQVHDADSILIIITDGIDNGPNKHKKIQLPPDVRIFTVGINKVRADRLLGINITSFESIDAAIQALRMN